MTRDILGEIIATGVLPVVTINNIAEVDTIAEHFKEVGLNCIEITFRSEVASDAIKKITTNYPDILVGAGTILNMKDLKSAIENGADFIVTPGLNLDVIKYCLDTNIPIFPGVSTATEIQTATNMGIKVQKFFPSEISGGSKAIQSFTGPYPDVKFIPTGGINFSNLRDYLRLDNVLACGGTWITKNIDDLTQFRIDLENTINHIHGVQVTKVEISKQHSNYEDIIVLKNMFGYSGKIEFVDSSISQIEASVINLERFEKYLRDRHIVYFRTQDSLKVDLNQYRLVFIKGR